MNPHAVIEDAAILILAAGESSRMGTSKQLISVDGEPLLRRAAKVAIECSSQNVVVVLGARHLSHRPVISDLPLTIVVNDQWTLGIGRSIKVGLAEILRSLPAVKAVLIMVCDQPYLEPSHLRRLLVQPISSGAPVAASSYRDIAGVPAVFHHSIFAELEQMSDHHGARSLVTKYAKSELTVPFPRGEFDLDTPEDLERFEHEHNKKG